MDGTHTKMNENNATIFIPIRVSSYPCFHYPWLFSQEIHHESCSYWRGV